MVITSTSASVDENLATFIVKIFFQRTPSSLLWPIVQNFI